VNRERATEVGKKKKAGTYEPKEQGRHENHYPWEEWTICVCDVCASLGLPSRHKKKLDWQGRGMPHIRCEKHETQLRSGFIFEMPESYTISWSKQ
jgi:hypothetical protein